MAESNKNETMDSNSNSNSDINTDTDVIWRVGVYDAHCHPTDIMASLNNIPGMHARALTVMATRSQDQDLVYEAAERFPLTPTDRHMFDVDDSAKKCVVVPSFGWHPWFSHLLIDDTDDNDDNNDNNDNVCKDHDIDSSLHLQHYKTVLTPKCGDDNADNADNFIKSLPKPIRLSQYLGDTEARLRRFPYALVGEIGLDRSFRLPSTASDSPDPNPNPDSDRSGEGECEDEKGEHTPGTREGRPLTPYRVSLQHQKAILKAQLQLAGKLHRPVSVHSVQTHGAVFDVLQSLWKGHQQQKQKVKQHKNSKHPSASASASTATFTSATTTDGSAASHEPLPYPPRICMHSYSGPPDALSQFLSPAVPAEIYFSFSTVINLSSSSTNPSPKPITKTEDVIRRIPDDRILIESDLHCAGTRMDHLLKDVTLKVCQLKGWNLEAGARQLKKNYLRFIFGAENLYGNGNGNDNESAEAD